MLYKTPLWHTFPILANKILFMVFIFYLILIEYNAPQDFKPHYTLFNIMSDNAHMLTGPLRGAKRPKMGALSSPTTTHGVKGKGKLC
ncbi:hypothetical protein Hanom_Chr05g00399941 [Helianthus anomalus]